MCYTCVFSEIKGAPVQVELRKIALKLKLLLRLALDVSLSAGAWPGPRVLFTCDAVVCWSREPLLAE